MTIHNPLIKENKIKQLSFNAIISFFEQVKNQAYRKEDVVFICVGTDRSTGDSFGPITGSLLVNSGFPYVYGTLDQPCDAHTVEAVAAKLKDESRIVVAIDACLGKEEAIGSFILKQSSLLPGSALGRRLPAVGDYSIAAVVNQYGPKAYWKLQNTSLHIVLQMAQTIGEAAQVVWDNNL